MTVLSVAIVIFAVLEVLNIATLYFAPGSRKGNGIGVFNAYEESKAFPEIHALVNYLINWVAGTKLIFIALLIVILATADETTKLFTVAALILSIFSFFWRLFPSIRRMDRDGQITPKGYSKTLGVMIASFVGGFAVAFIVALSLGV